MFLKPFAAGIEAEDGQEPALKWAHIDIAGAMDVSLLVCFHSRILIEDFLLQTNIMTSYMEKGMSGRPVR